MLPTTANALGTHILLELNQCPAALLLEKDTLETALVQSAEAAGATVVKPIFHQFSPHGLSGVVVIAESHIAVHTWPEHSYAAIDIFTCGDPVIASRIQAEIEKRFAPAQVSGQTITRGPSV
ncbi:adenosylmethionine decarboxylase [Pelagicoccus sp. NFK12]|uniref:S-adenosylmethionine decarboxylase proenzyme n=1 Tax=Pelagicoccus enzymogenes TaxID=2773457 RepID=A0A927F9T4_9BACT|nr:adenosylmethionine decarboxylase [Pelagicoccus enzymogenes]MBD5780954.1 adenosylmethionine decarboxylase [Pelagicoccus enzymogenes]